MRIAASAVPRIDVRRAPGMREIQRRLRRSRKPCAIRRPPRDASAITAGRARSRPDLSGKKSTIEGGTDSAPASIAG